MEHLHVEGNVLLQDIVDRVHELEHGVIRHQRGRPAPAAPERNLGPRKVRPAALAKVLQTVLDVRKLVGKFGRGKEGDA
jgi:hypothetical protein